MLQRGHYVADVLWYYGEDGNVAGIYGKELPPVPEGYSYDFINPYGVKNLLSVKDGSIVTPSGMKYKVLVLGERCKTMSIEVLRKIDELANAGAVICGTIPEAPAGMTDDPVEFERLVADIWRSGRSNVYTGLLSNVLKSNGVEPDFQYVAPADIKFVHRTDGDKEIYWVRNFSDNAVKAQLTLRDIEGPCKVYDPETGKTLSGVLDGNCLELEANQALFVVSDRNGKPDPVYIAPRKAGAVTLDGPWTVSFDGLGAPEGTREYSELASYTESEEFAVKYFSGTATYTNTFTLGKKDAVDGLSIDLGNVGQMADIFVNGEHVRFIWKAPYKVQWTGSLKPGKNTIEIKVVNLWPNRLIGDQQPGAEKVTYTGMSFYRENSPLMPSGLMGPVVIEKLLK